MQAMTKMHTHLAHRRHIQVSHLPSLSQGAQTLPRGGCSQRVQTKHKHDNGSQVINQTNTSKQPSNPTTKPATAYIRPSTHHSLTHPPSTYHSLIFHSSLTHAESACDAQARTTSARTQLSAGSRHHTSNAQRVLDSVWWGALC
jgi:hypothetical protein